MPADLSPLPVDWGACPGTGGVVCVGCCAFAPIRMVRNRRNRRRSRISLFMGPSHYPMLRDARERAQSNEVAAFPGARLHSNKGPCPSREGGLRGLGARDRQRGRPGQTKTLFSHQLNVFNRELCDSDHILLFGPLKTGLKCASAGPARLRRRAGVTHEITCATIFPLEVCAWKIGPPLSLPPTRHRPQRPRSSMKAAEHGCSRHMACRDWRCLEFSPTFSRTLSPISPRMQW